MFRHDVFCFASCFVTIFLSSWDSDTLLLTRCGMERRGKVNNCALQLAIANDSGPEFLRPGKSESGKKKNIGIATQGTEK